MNPTKRKRQIDIVQELWMELVSGAYAAGDLLPSISGLKEEYGVSMSVIREALKVLSGKGLIESRQKRWHSRMPA